MSAHTEIDIPSVVIDRGSIGSKMALNLSALRGGHVLHPEGNLIIIFVNGRAHNIAILLLKFL
jgi:hypothetical protein